MIYTFAGKLNDQDIAAHEYFLQKYWCNNGERIDDVADDKGKHRDLIVEQMTIECKTDYYNGQNLFAFELVGFIHCNDYPYPRRMPAGTDSHEEAVHQVSSLMREEPDHRQLGLLTANVGENHLVSWWSKKKGRYLLFRTRDMQSRLAKIWTTFDLFTAQNENPMTGKRWYSIGCLIPETWVDEHMADLMIVNETECFSVEDQTKAEPNLVDWGNFLVDG